MDKKRPLCAAPFLGFYWKGNSSPREGYDGLVKSCCESRHATDELGNRISRDIPIKDITSPAEIMESDLFKSMRAKLIEGEWHELCWECKYKEDVGANKSRDVYNVIAKSVEELYPDIEYNVEKGNSLEKLFWLDYRPSNLCNLKCRMCSPFSSSLFAQEVMSIPEVEREHFMKAVDTGFQEDNIYDKTKEKDKLYELLDLNDIIFLKLLGGEPLFMKEPREMIETVGPHAEVVITTNATKIQDSFVELVNNKEAKRIHFQISLDGIEDVYEYIRAPGSWDLVEANIHKLYGLQQTAKSEITISNTFVIQMWNVFQVPEIIEWNVNMFRHYNPAGNRGSYMAIVTQKWLHINLLTEEHQRWLLDSIYEVRDRLVLTEAEIKRYIVPIERMLAVPVTPEERAERLEQFKNATDEFDFRRDQDIFSIDERFGDYV